MNLREIINELENLSDDFVIFACKNGEWKLDATAALIIEDDLDSIGTNLEGLKYFLEVETAKGVLNVWKGWRNGREPNESERIEAIVYYANNDAYIGQV